MSRWFLAFVVGVLAFCGLVVAGMTDDFDLLAICIPLGLFAVLLWWWLIASLSEERRQSRNNGEV